MSFDINVIVKAIPYLTKGLYNTLLLTVLGIVCSTFLGIICAILRISRNALCRFLLATYVEIFRNTPIVAQIFYLYFALPLIGLKVSAFNCGLIALVLHFNAYNIETFRSGLEAVPHGLHEAGAAIGFTYAQQLRLIVLPLALGFCLPSLVNNYVSLLKHTAVVSVIGVVELTFVVQDIIANDFTVVEMYSVLSTIYILLVFGLTWILRRIEKRYAMEL
jgi:His/Glu/Gln/Arg/opine family amino acid ABC transporter permease subunit